MKRAETFWQALVLFLVFLMTVGVYIMLAWALHRIRGEGQAVASPLSSQANHAVQIVEPLTGTVVQYGVPVTLSSVVVERGFSRAELWVDKVLVAIEVNSESDSVPWTVEWAWGEADEGEHELLVQAHRSDGDLQASAPVTVTVVPVGQLAFASNRDGVHAVYAMQSDGRNLTRLTSGPSSTGQPAWARDGALAFVADTGAGHTMIRKSENVGDVGTDLVAGRDPAWSPDGTSLAYAASIGGVSQVFTIASGKRDPIAITSETVYAGQPTWSPDGTYLAYSVEREGNWDIWVTDLDGVLAGYPRRLTDDPAMDWAPAWSPDGSHLAFVSTRGGEHQIYTMRVDGTEVHPLTDFPKGAEAPAWSPDGYWLAFVAYTGDGVAGDAREIYLMRADGQHRVRLTHNAFDDTEPHWAWVP